MRDRWITARLAQSKKHILLLGPRQVGKSTLVRSLHPDFTVNLADAELFLSYSKDPGRLGREIRALKKTSLVFLDEIQRLPSLLNTVQSFMDEGLKHRFILSGSSARKLKRGGANLLPGRILLEYLDPLSLWELKEDFDLDKILQRGGLPEVYLNEEEGMDILETYASVYLREEIQAEALAKNVGAYARFLDIAAESSGEWINYSKVASDSEIPKETIRRFFTILEDTLLVFRIPAYRERSIRRRVSQRDRCVFFDPGVRNALLGIHRSTISREEKGKLFEQWFILQIIYFVHAAHKPWKIFSYRTDTGVEVDLIVDTGKHLLALECKASKNVTDKMWRGIRSFSSVTRKPVLGFLVYQGDTRQKFGSSEYAVPFREFLTQDLLNLDGLGG